MTEVPGHLAVSALLPTCVCYSTNQGTGKRKRLVVYEDKAVCNIYGCKIELTVV